MTNPGGLPTLACPLCEGTLEPTQGRHGLVWLCHRCRAGAATLPVLRRVAPRGFVDRVWQAALHDGRVSRFACPSCGHSFTRLRAAGDALLVCIACFWIWVRTGALTPLTPRLSAPEALRSLATRALTARKD